MSNSEVEGVHTLGTNDPSNSPARESEALSETINNKNIILINILNILRRRDGSTITVASVVVARVELITDESSTTTANVLNLRQLRVSNHPTSRVTRVRRQDDRGTTSDFLSNLVRMDMVAILLVERHRNGSKVSEERQHLVVGRVVRQEKRQVRSSQHGSDTDQTSTATGHNSHVLPRILAVLALAVHLVVELGDSLAEGFDTGGGGVLASVHGNFDLVGALEAALDVVLYLGGTLAQVGPGILVLKVAKLGGALGAPDYTGGGAAGVQTGMGQVTFVGATELTMDLGLDL